MTLRPFGRVTPIHKEMLRLAGYVVDYDQRTIRLAKTDDDFFDTMREGRRSLRKSTGRDFGFDLAAWREFLAAAPDDEFGYRHPYAFRGVDGAVRRATKDPRRAQLVEQLKT
jgi:hypothetical protein